MLNGGSDQPKTFLSGDRNDDQRRAAEHAEPLLSGLNLCDLGGSALYVVFGFSEETLAMLRATAGKLLPTTITGSLPRPSWYTENLGIKSFLDAMVISRFREQYVDALSCYLREQEVAGLDIVTDGDCRFDQDVGGQSWTSYP